MYLYFYCNIIINNDIVSFRINNFFVTLASVDSDAMGEGPGAKGTLMAVKVVELGELDKENSKEAENLERELQLMKLFKHENIVRYYGCKHGRRAAPAAG